MRYEMTTRWERRPRNTYGYSTNAAVYVFIWDYWYKWYGRQLVTHKRLLVNETRCEECGAPVEDDMCVCYVCAQRNQEAKRIRQIRTEKANDAKSN